MLGPSENHRRPLANSLPHQKKERATLGSHASHSPSLSPRLGEHGQPRMDTSEHVFFLNDQLAVRFIEEVDFDYCAADATAALITAAS